MPDAAILVLTHCPGSCCAHRAGAVAARPAAGRVRERRRAGGINVSLARTNRNRPAKSRWRSRRDLPVFRGGGGDPRLHPYELPEIIADPLTYRPDADATSHWLRPPSKTLARWTRGSRPAAAARVASCWRPRRAAWRCGRVARRRPERRASCCRREQAFRLSARALDDRDDRGALRRRRRLLPVSRQAALSRVEPGAAPCAECCRAGSEARRILRRGRTYRGTVVVRVPLARGTPASRRGHHADSQGCADVGVCYPAHAQQVTLALPAGGRGSGPFVEATAQEDAGSIEPVTSGALHSPDSRWLAMAAIVAFARGRRSAAGIDAALPARRRRAPRIGARAAHSSRSCCRIVAGKEQRLDQWRGKVLVVNFWATWCAPCREEMPRIHRARSSSDGAKGLQFVGIAVDQADKVARFRRRRSA